jgi:hypothetical protein
MWLWWHYVSDDLQRLPLRRLGLMPIPGHVFGLAKFRHGVDVARAVDPGSRNGDLYGESGVFPLFEHHRITNQPSRSLNADSMWLHHVDEQ